MGSGTAGGNFSPFDQSGRRIATVRFRKMAGIRVGGLTWHIVRDDALLTVPKDVYETHNHHSGQRKLLPSRKAHGGADGLHAMATLESLVVA